MFLFPQSDDISGGLPQGIGFGEREIYILAKEYFFAKAVLLKERMMKEIEQFATQFRRAIDLALEAGEFDNDSIYRRFPRACCGDTSDLLAQYLLDKGNAERSHRAATSQGKKYAVLPYRGSR